MYFHLLVKITQLHTHIHTQIPREKKVYLL